MKSLTITVDDKVLFSGEVAELHWSETDQSVSVTGKFKQQLGFLQTLTEMAKANTPPKTGDELSQNDSVQRPGLEVVRDDQ